MLQRRENIAKARTEENKAEKVELLEYEQLRREINDNKKYVFERPLLIILTGVIAILTAKDSSLLFYSFPLLTMILWLDLELCINRFRSNSRIIAFVDVKYKDTLQNGIPLWETALSLYRNRRDDRNNDNAKKEKTFRFYWILALFHICPSIFFTLISSMTYIDGIKAVPRAIETDAIKLILTIVCGCATAWQIVRAAHFGFFRVRSLIVNEKSAWSKIFGAGGSGR